MFMPLSGWWSLQQQQGTKADSSLPASSRRTSCACAGVPGSGPTWKKATGLLPAALDDVSQLWKHVTIHGLTGMEETVKQAVC